MLTQIYGLKQELKCSYKLIISLIQFRKSQEGIKCRFDRNLKHLP